MHHNYIIVEIKFGIKIKFLDRYQFLFIILF
jgi:hypothetical protein